MDDETLSDEQGSPEQPNGEISISLLRAKNLSLLQSQYVYIHLHVLIML